MREREQGRGIQRHREKGAHREGRHKLKDWRGEVYYYREADRQGDMGIPRGEREIKR